MRKQDRVIGHPQSIPHSMIYSTSTAPDDVFLTDWILPSQHNQCFWANSWNDPSIPNPFLMLTMHYNLLFSPTLCIFRRQGETDFFPDEIGPDFSVVTDEAHLGKENKIQPMALAETNWLRSKACLKWGTLLGTASLLSTHQRQAAGGFHPQCLLWVLFLPTHPSLLTVLCKGT